MATTVYRFPSSLLRATVVRRPSASNRSPYVADVVLEDDDTDRSTKKSRRSEASTQEYLAHAPSLGLAGLISAGERVLMSKNASATAKTAYKIELALERRLVPGVTEATLVRVGANPMLAEKCVKGALEARCIEALGPYERFESQKTFGESRVDFVLHRADEGGRLLVEVKNVPLADVAVGCLPEGRATKDPLVYEHTAPYAPTALFPMGNVVDRKLGVVSQRAIKHVCELTTLHSTPDNGLQCALLFVVTRTDCVRFRAAHECDALFAQVLYRAHCAGVQVLAYAVSFEDDGQVRWGPQLPVTWAPEAMEPIDQDNLKRVLEYVSPRK